VLGEARVTIAMTRLDAIWGQLFPAKQQRIVCLLVEKVIVSPNDIEVRLRQTSIAPRSRTRPSGISPNGRVPQPPRLRPIC
jgi:hypothetical protein